MNTDDNQAAELLPIVYTPVERQFTSAHLEPWRGDMIDVTMRDGSHRIGRLHGLEGGVATLRGIGEKHDSASFRVADACRVERAPLKRMELPVAAKTRELRTARTE